MFRDSSVPIGKCSTGGPGGCPMMFQALTTEFSLTDGTDRHAPRVATHGCILGGSSSPFSQARIGCTFFKDTQRQQWPGKAPFPCLEGPAINSSELQVTRRRNSRTKIAAPAGLLETVLPSHRPVNDAPCKLLEHGASRGTSVSRKFIKPQSLFVCRLLAAPF